MVLEFKNHNFYYNHFTLPLKNLDVNSNKRNHFYNNYVKGHKDLWKFVYSHIKR